MKHKNKTLSLKDRLRLIVNSMPDLPGSYQFWDEKGVVIYVGKAKSLKRRVASYFRKDVSGLKTKLLVGKIADITYTVVNTEEDALLLENELIKKYQPRYNILLKDGKTYPYICVTKEAYPRVFPTRIYNRSVGSYFGPYAHAATMHAMLQLIHQLFHLRTCRKSLTEENVWLKKYHPCLEYHIHRCEGPCVNKVTKDDYLRHVRQAVQILKGDTRALSKEIYEEMLQCASKMQYERAEALKQKFQLLDSYCAKSEVVSPSLTNVDVFSLTNDGHSKMAFVNYLHVVNGAINQALTYEYKRNVDEDDAELLSTAITEIRKRNHSEAKEVVVPFGIDWQLTGVVFTVPQRGDKKRLLELSLMNGKQYMLDKLKQADKLNPEQRQTRVMTDLKQLLNLKKLPIHVECFDNSNISGSDAVAACVVYRNLKPSRKEYRKYLLRQASTNDDYAQMQEVVRRRYQRMVNEGTPLPDLIITDGGIGHMTSVREVVCDELSLDIPIAGLAKDGKHRTNQLLFGFPPQVVDVNVKSELFRILTQMQDEVHRVAVAFHRDKRSKHALHSELDRIKGVGEKSREQLLAQLKNVRNIRQASVETLTAIVGKAKAEAVYSHFHAIND